VATIPAEYVLSGDARQLLQTLSEVSAAFQKTEGAAKKAGDGVGALPAKAKPAATSLDRLTSAGKVWGGQAGQLGEKVGHLSKLTAGLSSSQIAAGAAVAGSVAFVAALAAGYVALGAAIAKTVLSAAEWDQQLGTLSPLTDAQTKAVKQAASSYDNLGTQAKITGTKIGGAFADEVQVGISALNGLMARADGVATVLLGPLSEGIGKAATLLSYLTPTGNAVRLMLQGLAEDGEQAVTALDMGKLGGQLKAINDQAKTAADERRKKSGEETGNLDGILAAEEAAQAADEKRKDAISEQTRLEREAHAQYMEELLERKKFFGPQGELSKEQARLDQEEQDRLEAEAKARDDLHKKRIAYEKEIADTQARNHAAELARIESTVNTILSLAAQVADLVNAIADAVGGEGEGSEKRKKWTQRLLGGLAVAGGVALSTVPGGAAAGVPLALSGGSAIASSFPSGGMVREYASGTGRTPDHFPVAVQAREAILNRAAAERLGETGVDALNRGAMPGGVVDVAMVYRHRVFNRFVSDHLRRSGALSKAITGAKRRGHSGGR
jgi:hypothetical protein